MCIIYPIKNSESEIKHGCITIQSSTQDPKEKMLKIIGLAQTRFFLVKKEDGNTSAHILRQYCLRYCF
jgi:hypothetical protein